MPYHVVYSFHDTMIYAGAGDDPECTYDTFEEAKKHAIDDLTHWIEAGQARREEIAAATSLSDLVQYQPDGDF